MKEFLYLFRGGDAARNSSSPEAMQEHMGRWVAWMQSLAKEGVLVGGQPLETDGKTLSGSKKVVTDGPYAESKEMVGGYLIVKAEDLNKAVEISKGCPIFEHNGIVEVRGIAEMKM